MLIVVDDPTDWPLKLSNVEIVKGQEYLTNPQYQQTQYRGEKVFNCCRSYKYQSTGYYVSLLAEARGHKPFPSISTIQDLRFRTLLKINSEDLDELIQKLLKPLKSKEFVLSIYFGRNLASKYSSLCSRLYKLYPAPFLQAKFVQEASSSKWLLRSLSPIALRDIPTDHWPFVTTAATAFFAGKKPRSKKDRNTRFDLAILTDQKEKEKPSNPQALEHFKTAAEELGFRVEEITKEDYGRLSEFDALFIRETTSVKHHTWRFARRAAANGLVVIDDPISIFRCCNKVYLAELLSSHGIATPKTIVLHKNNISSAAITLGLPAILKKPDSSFSQGVLKVSTLEEFKIKSKELLESSDLIIAQEYVPTAYDWRVGIIDRQPLFVARYHMVPDHWQIYKHDENGQILDDGAVDCLAVENAPKEVVKTALKAANLIGDGLYGVDLKEINGKVVVIEVNDNPNIDAGLEDKILGPELYKKIMQVFLQRVERKKQIKPLDPLSIKNK